jgi:hypothetical protein
MALKEAIQQVRPMLICLFRRHFISARPTSITGCLDSGRRTISRSGTWSRWSASGSATRVGYRPTTISPPISPAWSRGTGG